jgi:hypothetical protein
MADGIGAARPAMTEQKARVLSMWIIPCQPPTTKSGQGKSLRVCAGSIESWKFDAANLHLIVLLGHPYSNVEPRSETLIESVRFLTVPQRGKVHDRSSPSPS